MKLLRGLRCITEFDKGVVATIGNFDGVHLGHQNLLDELKNKAKSMNLPTVVILFEPQPREFFEQDNAPARLSSLRDKLAMLHQFQIDYVYCIHFNQRLAQTSADDFIRLYLMQTLNVKYLIVGQDFKFGKNKEGTITYLKEQAHHYSFAVTMHPDICIAEQRVSSTLIRHALKNNQLQDATRLLGRHYSICGRVVKGDGRGRQWGIPTANVRISPRLNSLNGVFVVLVQRGLSLIPGVANLGQRPTVDGTKRVLEVHIFDFAESIYGEFVHVFFLHKVRDEVKFTSVDALIERIHQDIVAAKAFLAQSAPPLSVSCSQDVLVRTVS